MSDPTTEAAADGPPTHEPGLVAFYSSQARLMLEQYRNIEHLLGQTDDWTGPGTHCEVLLRDLLRRYLPSCYSVDKGFMYGRRPVDGGSKHSPEIDILVHEIQEQRPILQIEDFVIAQAKATYAAIQVKRRMDYDKLEEAVTNVKEAREHFRVMNKSARGSLSFFSAVVFFDEKSPRQDNLPSETYANCLHRHFSDPASWVLAPDFIGSLQHHVFYREKYWDKSLAYVSCPAVTEGLNVAGQILLWAITQKLGRAGCQLPFSFPSTIRGRRHEISTRPGFTEGDDL